MVNVTCRPRTAIGPVGVTSRSRASAPAAGFVVRPLTVTAKSPGVVVAVVPPPPPSSEEAGSSPPFAAAVPGASRTARPSRRASRRGREDADTGLLHEGCAACAVAHAECMNRHARGWRRAGGDEAAPVRRSVYCAARLHPAVSSPPDRPSRSRQRAAAVRCYRRGATRETGGDPPPPPWAGSAGRPPFPPPPV